MRNWILNIMENGSLGLKYALSGHMEIHLCVLQDVGLLGPLPCSHSTFSANHSKQGIGYRWPCAILGWLVTFNDLHWLDVFCYIFVFMIIIITIAYSKWWLPRFSFISPMLFSLWPFYFVLIFSSFSSLLPQQSCVLAFRWTSSCSYDHILVFLIRYLSLLHLHSSFQYSVWKKKCHRRANSASNYS